MWLSILAGIPGLSRAMDRAQPGIVHTPEDMQAESDAADTTPADAVETAAPEPPKPFGPEPGAPPRPEIGPGRTPPPDAPATAAAPDPVPDAAPRRRAPTLEQSLQTANARLRQERDTARAERDRFTRLLDAERRAHADTIAELEALRAQSPQHDRSTTRGGEPGRPSAGAEAGDSAGDPLRVGAADREAQPSGDAPHPEGIRPAAGDQRAQGRQ